MVKFPDERRTEGISTQATYTRGSSAASGGIHEQRHAAERVLSQSAVELWQAESALEEATLEEEEQGKFVRPIGAGGVGRKEIADAARIELRAGRGPAGRAPDRSAARL